MSLIELIIVPALIMIVVGGTITAYMATARIFAFITSENTQRAEALNTIAFVDRAVKSAAFIVPDTDVFDTDIIDLHFHAGGNIVRLEYQPPPAGSTGPGRLLFYPDRTNLLTFNIVSDEIFLPAGRPNFFNLDPINGKAYLEIRAGSRVTTTKYRSVDIGFSLLNPVTGQDINFNSQAATPQEFFLMYVDTTVPMGAFQDGSQTNPYRQLDDALNIATQFNITADQEWPGDHIIVRNGNHVFGPGRVNIFARAILFEPGTTVTVSPGTIMQMGRQSEIIIQDGLFRSVGTAVNPIQFIALNPIPAQPVNYNDPVLPWITNNNRNNGLLAIIAGHTDDWGNVLYNKWGRVFLLRVTPGNTHDIQNTTFENGRRVITANESNINIDNCSFRHNYSHRRFDGTIDASQIRGGGAIYINGASGTATINNSDFFDNLSNRGGAIWLRDSRTNITNCTFTNNKATTFGGAIEIWNHRFANPVDIEYCLFQENKIVAEAGGGGGAISERTNRWGNIRITRCVFNDNYSGTHRANFGGRGGAILATSQIIINHCTFFENKATRGGGFFIEKGSLHSIGNSILWQNQSFNTDDTGNQIFIDQNADQTPNNIINFCDVEQGNILNISPGLENMAINHPDNNTTFTPWFAGTGNIAGDPLFVDQAAGDFNLSLGSPCLDAAEDGVENIGAF
jgi:predicted outer membrane repeat protein